MKVITMTTATFDVSYYLKSRSLNITVKPGADFRCQPTKQTEYQQKKKNSPITRRLMCKSQGYFDHNLIGMEWSKKLVAWVTNSQKKVFIAIDSIAFWKSHKTSSMPSTYFPFRSAIHFLYSISSYWYLSIYFRRVKISRTYSNIVYYALKLEKPFFIPSIASCFCLGCLLIFLHRPVYVLVRSANYKM